MRYVLLDMCDKLCSVPATVDFRLILIVKDNIDELHELLESPVGLYELAQVLYRLIQDSSSFKPDNKIQTIVTLPLCSHELCS